MSPHDVRLVRIAVATAAFATLAYELSLTRIFSVLFRSPFVFLILSIAVCGLGLGAVLAAILDSRGDADRTDPARYLGWPLLAFGLLLPVPLVLLLTVAQGLVADARGALVAVLTAAPYLAAGLFMSRAFRRHALDAGRLYFFDLCGAGLAALASVPILTRVGGLAMPLLLGALVLLVALPLLRGRRVAQAVAAAALVACVAATMAQVRSGWLSLPAVTSTDSTIAKPLFQELGDPAAGAKVLYTEWSAVARTDVVSNTGTETLFIWTDGDVPTQMEPFSGNLEDMASARGFIGYVPFGLRPSPERVLCIGPGGGLDVLLALLGDAKSIEAVELNPAMQNVVDRYRDFYGDLYQRPELGPGLIIDEGRSYMQRSTRQFDVIYFALAKSATTQQGGMALVDNYLYTEEAFDAYWSRLSDNGLLALVFQNPALTDRCLATMASALMKAGLSGDDIAERIAYMNISPEVFASTPYQFLLLLSKRPFSDDERDVLKLLGTGYQLRYAPGVAEFPPYANVRGVSSGTEYAAALAARSDYLTRVEEGGPLVRLDLSPVTDDQPFYADLAPGLNPMLRPILNFSLWAGLLVILGALAWVAWGGGVLRPESRVAERLRGGVAPVAYFAGLGAAFMLVEVALIQKLVLVLGYPTLSLTVILFTLLVGGSLGGLLANRGTPDQAMARLAWLGPLVAVYQVVLALLAPVVGAMVLGAPVVVRVAVVAAAVLPLGLLMGQPFPSGLRWLGAHAGSWVPMAWAVNGVLSVTGSVLAAAGASIGGYRFVMYVGAAMYLATCVVGWWWARANEAVVPTPALEGLATLVANTDEDVQTVAPLEEDGDQSGE